MKTNNIALLICLFLMSVIISCSKHNLTVTEPSITYNKITEGYAPGAAAKVEVYTIKTISTGYNNIYLSIKDSVTSQPLNNAVVNLRPIMDMGTMKHSSPVEQPVANTTNKMYSGAVVFTMPSGTVGSWSIDITVQNGHKLGKLSVPITVAEGSPKKIKSFISKADSAKFFVTLIEPSSPKVGVNELELAIFKVKNMMEFPADSSLHVSLTPEMPTMGHGSPNNTDPVHTKHGHYKGKVKFTMTGLWHLNFDFRIGAAIADTTTYFEVTF